MAIRLRLLTRTHKSREWPLGGATQVPSPQPHRYPNPGFLGPSSHSTILSQLSTSAGAGTVDPEHQSTAGFASTHPSEGIGNDQIHATIEKCVGTLQQLGLVDIANLKALVETWMGEGINLPLAGPLVPHCADATKRLWNEFPTSSSSPNQRDEWNLQHARFLSNNTHKPIRIDKDTDVAGFLSQILEDSLRWETIGIFITAASRAVLDTASFPSLYPTEEQRRRLIVTLMVLGDACLDMCLDADNLNDLQLVLQYENFIFHSQIDGDQSK